MKRYCGMCDALVGRDAHECPKCGADTDPWPEDDEPRDDAYERAAARARLNDFDGGTDWT